jgi:hypothetical protein
MRSDNLEDRYFLEGDVVEGTPANDAVVGNNNRKSSGIRPGFKMMDKNDPK